MKPTISGIILGLTMLVGAVLLFRSVGGLYLDNNEDFMFAFGLAVAMNILGTFILAKEMENKCGK